MKQVRLSILFLMLVCFLKMQSQLANGYIKISALHKADKIWNTNLVKYKYSYTNAVLVAFQIPIIDTNTNKVVHASFEVGAGYAQFVKNASSYVVRADTPYAINNKAPRQDFNFNYAKGSFSIYLQYNRHIKKRLSWQLGLMYMQGRLSSSNVYSKPTYPVTSYNGHGAPPPSGYYYSSKVSITSLYGGINYYLYKNISISADIAINFAGNTSVNGYPANLFGYIAIDHSLHSTPFFSGMLKLSYSFLSKRNGKNINSKT